MACTRPGILRQAHSLRLMRFAPRCPAEMTVTSFLGAGGRVGALCLGGNISFLPI